MLNGMRRICLRGTGYAGVREGQGRVTVQGRCRPLEQFLARGGVCEATELPRHVLPLAHPALIGGQVGLDAKPFEDGVVDPHAAVIRANWERLGVCGGAELLLHRGVGLGRLGLRDGVQGDEDRLPLLCRRGRIVLIDQGAAAADGLRLVALGAPKGVHPGDRVLRRRGAGRRERTRNAREQQAKRTPSHLCRRRIQL